VSPELELWGFSIFLLFCRVGGCMMLAPGLSSVRIPIQIRLMVAVGIVLAISPILIPQVIEQISRMGDGERPLAIGAELLTGAMIGMMARLFFVALQGAATAIWSVIGLAGIPGIPLDELEAGSPLATLVSSAATVVVLSLGLHIEMIRAVLDSYQVIKLGALVEPAVLATNFMALLAETSLLMLRLTAPFIVYGLAVNTALGLANRFVQQISVYHATTGAVMLGGLFLLYLMFNDWMALFVGSYQGWLGQGGL
jgi:flagellar biosynthesis protein FliR